MNTNEFDQKNQSEAGMYEGNGQKPTKKGVNKWVLGIGAAALIEFLEIKNELRVMLLAGLLVSFPALASTYAYIFTADGYMLALCLAFFSVALTKRREWGFLPGGICLAFSIDRKSVV